MEYALEVAKEYTKLGLSIVPISKDKTPIGVWKHLQSNIINPEDFNKNSYGIAIIGGKVSGGLEAIDIDCKNDKTNTLWDDFQERLESNLPGILEIFLIEKTMNGGYHLIYRCENTEGNQKLANNKENPPEVLIETRGEGGYLACSPTPGYEIIQKNFHSIPTLTTEEREILLSVCKSFDCIDAKDFKIPYTPKGFLGTGLTPNDDYDLEEGTILSELESHGWKSKQGKDGTWYLTRPGKEKGISATLNQKNRAGLPNRFYLHSSSVSNIPLGKLLKPSAVYGFLNHNGDFTESAKKLYKEGFGARMDEVTNQKTQELEKEDKIVIFKNLYNPSVIAEKFLRTQDPIYYIREEFYQFNGMCYKVLEEDKVRAKIKKFLDTKVYLREKTNVYPIDVTKERISNILTNVLLSIIRDYKNNEIIGESLKGYKSEKLIILQNGLFDLDSQKLIPHTPDYFSTISLHINYDPNAECKNWLKYIDSQVEQKSQNLIQEWFGYNLTKTNPKQKYMVFYGLPGSGKSTALEILMELVGEGNYSAFTFEGMSSQFGLSHYVNKQAIFSGDAHLSSISNEKYAAVLERLKGITGGDLIEINRKKKDFISIQLPLKITFNVNEVPRFNDKANALMRRLLVVRFPLVIQEKDQNEKLREVLKSELPGIFNWAVNGYEYLTSIEKFTFIDEELKTEFKESNNPVQSFISEECDTDHHLKIDTKTLYKRWVSFCEENGFRPGSSSSFGVALSSLGFKKGRVGTGGRLYVYEGIDIK